MVLMLIMVAVVTLVFNVSCDSPVCPGVRMISLSYSRISLADIAQKLQLDSPEDAEFIVAKVTHAGRPRLRPLTRHG